MSVSAPRYRHAHQQQRERMRPDVEAGRAFCVEPICLMPDRWIQPGTAWDVSHDPTGTVTLGPSHARCNRSEGASRGNRTRASGASTANRWQL